MIVGYAQKGYVNEALDLFDKMPEKNVVFWTSMIVGYAQNCLVDEAAKLFDEMPEKNLVSCTSVISSYAQNGCVDEACKPELSGVTLHTGKTLSFFNQSYTWMCLETSPLQMPGLGQLLH